MAMWGMGVMVGPILGPTLGGWLTETYNWRWVFYINVPIGILTFAGLSAYLSETKTSRTGFDWFGFAMLSIAIGSFQMMLDRGEQLDWFSSTEIWIEAVLAALAFYLFIVQTFTDRRAALHRSGDLPATATSRSASASSSWSASSCWPRWR